MKSNIIVGKKWLYTVLYEQILGSKQESYIKEEEEMLKTKIYNYESLSQSEKLIYNQNKDDDNT